MQSCDRMTPTDYFLFYYTFTDLYFNKGLKSKWLSIDFQKVHMLELRIVVAKLGGIK